MRRNVGFDSEVRKIRERAAMARLRAKSARTTQERQHYAGMASYWEELLEDEGRDLET